VQALGRLANNILKSLLYLGAFVLVGWLPWTVAHAFGPPPDEFAEEGDEWADDGAEDVGEDDAGFADGEPYGDGEDEVAPDDAGFDDSGDPGQNLPAGEEDPGEADPGLAPPSGQPIEYPPEALELLPVEVLDALPKMLTAFLRPKDYAALKEACPQEDLAETIDCLDTPEVTDLLDTLNTRSVVASLLTYMDEDLPNRMSPEQLDQLAEGCNDVGEKWAMCAFTKGMEDEECFEDEEVLATCLVSNDLITHVYLEIQKDKKKAFGAELYVEFRGLLSTLTMDDINAAREACPQADQDALFECLVADEQVDELIGGFVIFASAIVDEVQKELTAVGAPLDEAQYEEYTEKFTVLLLTFPTHAISSLADDCEKQHPELEDLTEVSQIDEMLECISGGADTDPVANPAYISPERLRDWLELARVKVTDSLAAKEAEAQARISGYITIILSVIAAVGFFVVLLLPLRIRDKYQGESSQLWKASAVAAVTFVFTIALLGTSLLIMRTVQGSIATQSTSPKMVIANGVFKVLEHDKHIQQFSDMSKQRLDFIKTPLRHLVDDSVEITEEQAERSLAFSAYLSEHWVDQLQEPELRPLIKNATMLKGHVESFRTIFGFYRKVDWLMGYIPIIMSLLAVLLYMLPLRETLVTIATAPMRAAQSGSTQDMFKRAMATVGAELKLLAPFLGVMIVLLLVTGVFLSAAVQPFIEVLMRFSLMTVLYILKTEASGFVLYATLGGAILLLVACVAVYIIAMTFFLGTVRKILRARFHWGHPLSRYKAFAIYGSIAVGAVLVFPVVYAFAVQMLALQGMEVDLATAADITATDMLIVPFGGLLLMGPLLWAARGFKALAYIKKYPVVQDDPPA